MSRSARRSGFLAESEVFDLVLVVVMAGFVGARLFYVVQEWPWYQSQPIEILKIWKGGLVYYGGAAASLAALFIFVRRRGGSFLKTSDFVIPYIPLVHVFGRVGCFLNGCCYGKVCHLPWAVKFPSLAEPVHPIQLYEAAFNLVLFGILLRLGPEGRGRTTALYLILYSLGRFFLEFLRGDQTPLLFSLTLQQVLSLVFLLAGASLYAISRRPR